MELLEKIRLRLGKYYTKLNTSTETLQDIKERTINTFLKSIHLHFLGFNKFTETWQINKETVLIIGRENLIDTYKPKIHTIYTQIKHNLKKDTTLTISINKDITTPYEMDIKDNKQRNEANEELGKEIISLLNEYIKLLNKYKNLIK